jgi:acyl-coenzyme A thioesterase PaaI-like protein
MSGYTHVDGLRSADVQRLRATYEPLAESVRALIDAAIRSEVDAAEVAASDPDSPRFTGTLTIRYLRATPLGDLHAEGRITRTDGIKAFAAGHISDSAGITAEAEGVFILPEWARG